MGAALSGQLDGCPVGTRILAALYVGISLSVPTLATGNMQKARLLFLCSLYTVFGRGYFWTLLTSAFFRPLHSAMDIIMAAAELHMARAYLPRQEEELGSTRFLAWAILTTGSFFGGCWMPADDSSPPQQQQHHASGRQSSAECHRTEFQPFSGTGHRLGR